MRVVENIELKKFVEQKLYAGESPNNISGRIKKHEKSLIHVSGDSRPAPH